MKQAVSLYDFRDAFRRMDRMDQFTYEGLEVLFDYLEEYEDASDSEIELDVIALCCDYGEDTPEQIAQEYNIELDEGDTADMDDEEKAEALREAVVEYLEQNTSVCGETSSGTIVYCSAF